MNPFPEAILETPSGSALGETPARALLTVSPERQWFIYCSAVLQYLNAAQSNQINSTANYPDWVGPLYLSGFSNVYSLEKYPYVVMFESTNGYFDLTTVTEKGHLSDAGFLLDPSEVTYTISWTFRSLDALFSTEWLLGNTPLEAQPPNGPGPGNGFWTQNPGSPPGGPPYTLYLELDGGENPCHGFAVFQSPNYTINPAYLPPYYTGPGGPQLGTTMALNKAGTRGCVALHPYDPATLMLSPANPGDITPVNLTVDGWVGFNQPTGSGKAIVFWIGLTEAQVPDSGPAFSAASKGLLTVQ